MKKNKEENNLCKNNLINNISLENILSLNALVADTNANAQENNLNIQKSNAHAINPTNAHKAQTSHANILKNNLNVQKSNAHESSLYRLIGNKDSCDIKTIQNELISIIYNRILESSTGTILDKKSNDILLSNIKVLLTLLKTVNERSPRDNNSYEELLDLIGDN